MTQLPMKITGQQDLFLRNPTDEDLEAMRGTFVGVSYRMNPEKDIELLSAPKWNPTAERWEALANVGGALCLIEVTLKQMVEGKIPRDLQP